MDYYLSKHAHNVLKERNIPESWVWRTINNHDKIINDSDGTVHYLKSIKEREGRILRVVTNPLVLPIKVVTVFFDRRERKI